MPDGFNEVAPPQHARVAGKGELGSFADELAQVLGNITREDVEFTFFDPVGDFDKENRFAA